MRRLMFAAALALTVGCGEEPDTRTDGPWVNLEVRPPLEGEAPAGDLHVALVWSAADRQLGDAVFFATSDGRPAELGVQALEARGPFPAAALRDAPTRPGNRFARVGVVAFLDDDGDGALGPTPLDGEILRDRVVGWAMLDLLWFIELPTDEADRYQAGFNVARSGGEVTDLDAPIAVQLLAAEGAGCLGRALPPYLYSGALAAELDALFETDRASVFRPIDAVPPPCPGGRIPERWSGLRCRLTDRGRFRYTVEVLYGGGPLDPRCGPSADRCTVELEQPVPDAWGVPCP
jgi:hypothetical protein